MSFENIAISGFCRCHVVEACPYGGAAFTPDYRGFSWTLVDSYAPEFRAVDLAFLPNGITLSAQNLGLVKAWASNGTPLGTTLDLTDEVWGSGDAGLTSILVDPDFATSPCLYLMYTVDVATDPADYDSKAERFGRITRYTLDATTSFTTVIPSSRKVILGTT